MCRQIKSMSSVEIQRSTSFEQTRRSRRVSRRRSGLSQFLLQNCPRYCNLCDVAKERWERDQENKRMEMNMMNKDFEEGIQSPECDVVSGSTWTTRGGNGAKSTYTFREDGVFVSSTDMTCQKSSCKWSCKGKIERKIEVANQVSHLKVYTRLRSNPLPSL